MRKKLEKIEGERQKFKGTFVRFGTKSGWKGKTADTLLLRHVVDENENVITDHLWFNLTKQFESLALKEGDVVEFEARSTGYKKGYVAHASYANRREKDYKLSHPTKVRKLE